MHDMTRALSRTSVKCVKGRCSLEMFRRWAQPVFVFMAGEGKGSVQDDTKACNLFGDSYGGFSNGE